MQCEATSKHQVWLMPFWGHPLTATIISATFPRGKIKRRGSYDGHAYVVRGCMLHSAHPPSRGDPCQFAEKSAKDSEKNDRLTLPKRESVANCCYLAGPLSVASTFVIQTRCIYVLASAIQARCVPVMCYRGIEDAMSGYSSHSKCVCCELRRSQNRCKWLQQKIGFNWSGDYPSHLAGNSRSQDIMTTMWCLKVGRNLVCN